MCFLCSASAVVPTALDPDNLEQDVQSGDLDLLVRTTRLLIERTNFAQKV